MNLKYAWKNTTGWHVETVDGDDNVGKCTSIAIDGDDRPHISYYLLTNWDLRHARLVNGEWELETVDSEYKVGDGSSLAVDEYGKFFIAYFDWTNSKMKLASGNFGDWELESVDRDIWARPGGSHHTSIAIDEEGNPHIAYYYGTVERNPKYAALEGTIPGPDEFTVTACDGKVDVQWEIETLGRFDQVTGFQLLRAEDEYGMVKIADLIPGSTYYEDNDVTNGITYHYQLLVLNGRDELLRMDPLSATPLGIPSAPLSLNITVESDIIRVSWEPPADDGGSRIWSYTVYRYDPEQIKTENFGISVTDTYLEQNDVDVERGRTYEYWVVANNDVGEGEATDRVGAMMEEKDDSVDIVSWILTVFVILIIIAILSVVMILVIRRNNESCNDRRDTDHKGRRYR